jgi:hypothetical protein
VSKRNQNSRRKNYGRRQHELYERRQRESTLAEYETGADDPGSGGIADRLAFLGPRTSRLDFALGD